MTMYLRLRISYCGTMVVMCRGEGGSYRESGVVYLRNRYTRMHSRSCECISCLPHLSKWDHKSA